MDTQTTPDFIELQEALVGRYSIQRELGRGGMGVVYLAHEVALDRPVALKLLPPALAAQSALRDRFLREARTAAKLSHPNIVPIHSVDEVGEFVFFAMAYVDGESLGERIRARGPLTRTDAVRVVREVAWGLAYAHLHGVVHRDVKPDNILIERDSGRALVTDFGIAHLHKGTAMTGVGEIIGTAEFMSPEQAGGEVVDARSDIYSLGILAFYALTGTLPFEGDSMQAILAKHLTQPAPRLRSVAPEISVEVAQAVDRCLAKEPEQRYANGDELASALGGAIEKRREMPVPLRLFVKQVGERLRGTSMVAILGGIFVVAGALNIGAAPGAVVTMLIAIGGGLIITPGLLALGIARRAVRAGYSHEAAVNALAEVHAQAREEGAYEFGRRPKLLERVARWVAGASALAFAGGWALASILPVPTFGAVTLMAIALPTGVATAVIAQHRHDRRHDTPGKRRVQIWKSFFGKGIFKLARLTTGHRTTDAAPTYQRTELAIGMAADRLFEELPRAVKKNFRELPSVVTRLENDAQTMRKRIQQLDRLLSDIGAPSSGSPNSESNNTTTRSALSAQRESLAGDLTSARALAQTRLQDAVSALETVRLDLLRLHGGSGSTATVTSNLTRAADLSEEIARLLEGHEEVDRFLEGGDQVL